MSGKRLSKSERGYVTKARRFVRQQAAVASAEGMYALDPATASDLLRTERALTRIGK